MITDARLNLDGQDHRTGLQGRLDWARLWRLLARWSALLAVLSGVATTLQAGFGLSAFDGLEYLPRVTSLEIVRVLAGGAANAGTVLAIVQWAHPCESAQLRNSWRPTMIHGVLAIVVVSPVVALLALLSSFVVAAAAYGITWYAFLGGVQRTVTAGDCIFGLVETTVSGIVLVPLIGFLLPVLARMRWTLVTKMLVIWSSLFVVSAICRAFTS